MKRILALTLILMTSACYAGNREAKMFTFDNHIGSFPHPNGEPYLNLYPTTSTSTTGLEISPVSGESDNRCLKIVENTTGYSKFTLAYIDGLLDGDLVTVEGKVLAKDLFKMGYNFEGGRSFGSVPAGTSASSINGFENSFGDYRWIFAGTISFCSNYDYGDLSDNDGVETDWQILKENFIFDVGSTAYPPRTGAAITLYCAHDFDGASSQLAYADDLIISIPFRDANNDGINDVVIYYPDLTTGEQAPVPAVCVNRPLSDIASVDNADELDCTCNLADFATIAANWGKTVEKDVENTSANPEYQGYKTIRCGWEDSAIIADPNLALVVCGYDNDGKGYYSYHRPSWGVAQEGANDQTGHSLKCIMGPYPDSVELYVCKIYGLSAGDKIAASVMARKGQGNVRMWASYFDSTEKMAGSASGDLGYPTSVTQWSRLSHEWTFEDPDNDRYGLLIKIRCYGNGNGSVAGFIDDLVVRVPASCEVYLPGEEYSTTNGTPDYMLPICPDRPVADIDLNHSISIGDIAILASEWLTDGIED